MQDQIGQMQWCWRQAVSKPQTPCGLWGCKNRPASFPGRMSYRTRRL